MLITFLEMLLNSHDNKRFCLQAIRDKFSIDGLSTEEKMQIQASPSVWSPVWFTWPEDGEQREWVMSEVSNLIKTAHDNKFFVGIGINGFSKDRRKIDYVDCIRSFVVDIDGWISPENLQSIVDSLNPTWVSVSRKHPDDSEKIRAHLWFMLEESYPELIDDYMSYQKAFASLTDNLIKDLGDVEAYSDSSISSEKLIRLVGSSNFKDSAVNPWTVSGYAHNTKLWTLEEVRGLLSEIHEKPQLNSKNNTNTKTGYEFDGVGEGERHNTMVKRANIIVGEMGRKREWAWQVLKAENEKNTPPLAQDELEQIFTDTWNYRCSEDSDIRCMNTRGEGQDLKQAFDDKVKKAVESRNGDEASWYDYEAIGEGILSDVSIIRRLHQKTDGRVSYLQDSGKIFIWKDGSGCYEEDRGDLFSIIDTILDSLCQEPAVVEEFIEVKKDGTTHLNTKKLRLFIEAKKSATKITGLLGLVEKMPEFQAKSEDFNAIDNLIPDNSGSLILLADDKNEMKSCTIHKPAIKARFSLKLGASFDTASIDRNMKLDSKVSWLEQNRWTRFIYEVMDGDIEMCRFLQKVFGYSLGGGLEEQVLFFFEGGGCNGKSLCLETVKKAFGGFGMNGSSKLLCDDSLRMSTQGLSAIASFTGARMVVFSEIGKRDRLDESFIKDITVGDPIPAKHYYKPMFSYRPQFKTFLQGNHKPRIEGTDVGIWRRIIDIPFKVDFQGAEDRYLPKVLQSGEGLRNCLNWAVAGWGLYKDEGLVSSLPRAVDEAKTEYMLKMNPNQVFFDTCIWKHNTSIGLEAGDIYKCYLNWCKDNDVKTPLNLIWFGRELAGKGYSKYRTKTGIKYRVIVKNKNH